MVGALFVLGTLITITPSDDYTKIEAAKAGDEVVIAPGTYKFLVYLKEKGPITYRAQDPKNPPVWDLKGTQLDGAPGSYTAGDRGRGCWQLSGATGITIESIVFQNCSNADADAAGIRYYEGSSVTIRDCVFRTNDNGLTGGTQDSTATVEFSEFDSNGNLGASSPTHNVYIYGGTFAMRYSYLHDPIQSQNFHVRAHDSLIESNWIEHAASYEGDLMTDDDFTGAGPFTQNMVFRGNVIVEGTPANHGQIIALFNDVGTPNVTMSVHVINNTIVAAASQGAIVHLSNADHTKMSAEISNNILTVSTTSFKLEDAANATVSGTNNWFLTGTAVAPLTGSIFGSDPMFSAAYRLASGSKAIGAAANVQNTPITEYYLDDKTTRMYRVRSSVKDLGAFESTTTGPGIGPYDTQPVLDGGGGGDGGGTGDGGGVGDGGGNGDGGGDGGGGGSGCGCDVAGAPSSFGFGGALFALGLACRRRARRGT